MSAPLAPDDPRHGTSNGYANLGCRCDPCREARTEYFRSRKIGPYAENPCPHCGEPKFVRANLCRECYDLAVEAPHGSDARYSRGCRCGPCTVAASAAKRDRRMKSRVPCSHGCGTLVDSINRKNPDKPPECLPCALKRIHGQLTPAAA